jgi:syntaxin 16
MRGDCMLDEDSEVGMIEEEQSNRNSQINELVKTINQLSTIYKELNDLVVKQGSIIDRIDCNVEETFFQVEQGNVHLKAADENARSSCAERCMFVMLALIVVLAIILGLKYSK